MAIYLDTRGRTSLGIAVCARCRIKHARDELHPDPNYPGLMVCDDDRDQFDPYRLPARETENITMEWCRPDLSLSPGPMDVAINPMQLFLTTQGGSEISTGPGNGNQILAVAPPVTPIQPNVAWAPNTFYQVGSSVTASNPVGLNAAGDLFFEYVAIMPGTSGAEPPVWPTSEGVTVFDNQVLWLNQGLYLP